MDYQGRHIVNMIDRPKIFVEQCHKICILNFIDQKELERMMIKLLPNFVES